MWLLHPFYRYDLVRMLLKSDSINVLLPKDQGWNPKGSKDVIMTWLADKQKPVPKCDFICHTSSSSLIGLLQEAWIHLPSGALEFTSVLNNVPPVLVYIFFFLFVARLVLCMLFFWCHMFFVHSKFHSFEPSNLYFFIITKLQAKQHVHSEILPYPFRSMAFYIIISN